MSRAESLTPHRWALAKLGPALVSRLSTLPIFYESLFSEGVIYKSQLDRLRVAHSESFFK